MTNLVTTATRNLIAAGTIREVTEAGTRRLVTGHLSALTALMGGAAKTSNVLMARLSGVQPYGTMNHASVGMFPTEFEAFETIAGLSLKPTILLPDLIHFQTGIRTAQRAAGDKLHSFRQDSNIVGSDGNPLSTKETIAEIRRDLEEYWTRVAGRGS